MSEESSAPVSSTQPVSEGSDSGDISAEDLQALVGDEGQDAVGGGSHVESEGSGNLSTSAKDEVADAQAAVAEASSAKQKEEARKKLERVKKKYNLKVDGENFEWEGTDEDIVRELQLSRKARKEIQKTKEYEKEVHSLLDLLRTNPAAVLADPAIGIDVKQFAQDIINKQLEEEMKSPEQVEKERIEQELADLRAKHKDEEERRRTMEYEREVERQEADLQEKFIGALDESGMPNSPYLVKRMADVMLTGVEHNKMITPKQALNIVKREMRKDLSDMFSASKEDLIEELLGSDVVKRFNKHQLSKYKKSQSVPSTKNIKDVGASHKEAADRKAKPAEKQKISDWLYGSNK